jgi:hypothetical protein
MKSEHSEGFTLSSSIQSYNITEQKKNIAETLYEKLCEHKVDKYPCVFVL